MRVLNPVVVLVASAALTTSVAVRTQAPDSAQNAARTPADFPPDAVNLGADANGNPLRRALRTGHISNYDESAVAPYTLPDPLVTRDGRPVTTATGWEARRAEIVRMYEEEIYGRVPDNAPTIRWAVASTDASFRDGAAVLQRIVGTAGTGSDAPTINLSLVTPADASGPVPVVLLITFGGGPARGGGPGAGARGAGGGTGLAGEPPVAADMLARGWGYAIVGYQDIQPDRANSFTEGVIGQTLAPGQTAPAPGEWGTISAWAWGISRIIDYFETTDRVDAGRVAVQGFSRLGKTVLWASARDERIVGVFSGCSGEMGAALGRRDWGETIDDMAQNFAWQFAGRFQQWVGRWNDMPVDAHMLIALSAPRRVFITGGTTDQWADPRGEFLATVAASPVYRLLGGTGLGTSELPPLDSPVITGELGFNYHTGGHTVTPDEWQAFLQMLEPVFRGEGSV